MSERENSFFIPYQESSYPDNEKRIKGHLSKEVEEGFTLKKCEAYTEINKKCGKPASWVRVTNKIDKPTDTRFVHQMAVCNAHKTEEEWIFTSVSVDAEKGFDTEEGHVNYTITLHDDTIGQLSIKVILDQERGSFYAFVSDEVPSPLLQQMRERWKRIRNS